jgi:protein-tyrosine phosphatase
VPDGVAVHLLPFPDMAVTDEDAPHEVTFQAMLSNRSAEEEIAAAARRFMVAEYLRFPTLGGAQRAVRRVITLLADQRPVITHCFAGKDRTGFTVAVVLETVGVPRDVILADFLRSNAAVPTLRARLAEAIQRRVSQSATPEEVAFAEAQLTDEVLGVREEYLDAAHRSLTEHYGSLSGYLQAAGVTDGDVVRLRAALAG